MECVVAGSQIYENTLVGKLFTICILILEYKSLKARLTPHRLNETFGFQNVFFYIRFNCGYI